jgi:periplasmic protein CpxP/Spy
MKLTHALIAGVIAAVVLTVAATTYAQPTDGVMGIGPGHGSHVGLDPSAMLESHLTALKAQLNITSAQEAAWQAFTAQLQQQVASMRALHSQAQATTLTAPERMAQHAVALQQAADGMAATTNAFGALYAVLTPEQKAIADQHVGMMGHHGKHHG